LYHKIQELIKNHDIEKLEILSDRSKKAQDIAKKYSTQQRLKNIEPII
jgi:hypothetical protein